MDFRLISKAMSAFVLLGGVTVVSGAGCSSSSTATGGSTGDDDSGTGGQGDSGSKFQNGGDDDSGVPQVTCGEKTGYQCQIADCGGGKSTTLHGTVFDPAGKLPVYKVAVYVPNAAIKPLPDGVSCTDCNMLYTAPIAAAVTDAGGNFTIDHMPDGDNIPLVIQVGKWRRVYKLSHVNKCADNDAASLAGGRLQMPKNHTQGDIPKIAVSTGAADSLECLLHRMGIDDDEFTGDPNGTGRIHIFTGGAPGHTGATTNSPASQASYQWLWNDDKNLEKYDVVLLSCEGAETSYLDGASGRDFLKSYVDNGGRVFASHYHYYWFTDGPFSMATPALASWTKGAGFLPGKTDQDEIDSDIVTTLPGGAAFPEGQALKTWLSNAGALSNGKLPTYFSRHNADLGSANTISQSWANLSSVAPGVTQYFSFDTPIGSSPSEQCGRVVYSDLHVSGGKGTSLPNFTGDYASTLTIVPDQCATRDLSPQEKALEFMIFELSSCLTTVTNPPAPPEIPK